MRLVGVEMAVVVTGLGLRVRRATGPRARRDAAAIRALPPGATSRLSRTGLRGRFGALAAAEALSHSGAGPAGVAAAAVFLVVSMERGSECDDRSYWATVTDHGAALASPAGFATTLPSTVAGEIASAQQLTGPCLVFTGGAAGAIATAALVADDAPTGVTHVLLVVIRGEGDADARARAVLLRATRTGAPDGP